jgi:DNA-binding CsgD family transcriptional regulator/GAF domain-containing protein
VNVPPSRQAVDELVRALADEQEDLETVLRVAVGTLSRARRGTWYACVMCSDPGMSRVMVADDSDPKLADYTRRYMASLSRPGYAPTTGLSQRVIESGQPILVKQVPAERVYDYTTAAAKDWSLREPPPMDLRLAGTVVVPMRAGRRILGTLGFWEWNGDPLEETDVSWLQSIADWLGMVVTQTEMRTASATRLEQLTALYRVAFAIRSSQELRLTLDVIVEETLSRLRVDATDILLLDDASNELEVTAAAGFESTSIPEYRLPVPMELLDPATISSRADLVVCESNAIGRHQRRSLFAREGFRMYRAVPLVARRKLLGFLEVFHRDDMQPDQEWLSFLKAMGSHAAVAIELDRLQVEAHRAEGPQPVGRLSPELGRLDKKILAMVADGATNSEIAAQVNLSVHTVKFHVGRLLDRFGAANRTELARKATSQGLL